MKSNYLSFVAAVITALAASGATCMAGDWPRWGGSDPGRNMYSTETDLPDHFTATANGHIDLKPGTDDINANGVPNLKWSVKVGSQSYGNVVVAGGKVFIGTNNENPRDPQHQGDRSILMCFDEKTGEFLWQLVIPKLASGKVNDWENLGLLSSPNVEGDRVYIVTSRCEVMCLDVNGMANGNQGPFTDEAHYVTGPGNPPGKIGPHDADIIWKYDMMDELGVFPHNASNCSLLIVGDIIYACTSNGQDWTHVNIPSPNSPSLIAIDKHTGKLVGEDNAGIGPRIFHGEWSSPSTGVVNGRQLIFFGGGDGICYAFDAQPKKGDGSPIVPVVPGPPINRTEDTDTMYLKKVWWYDCNPAERRATDPVHKYPAPDGPSEVNATPVFWHDKVYVAVGQDPEHGEGVGILNCIDATKTGDVTKSGKIWSCDKIHRSLSTVSITPNGLLFIGDFSGFVHCLDANTGEVYWVHDMKAHMWGSTLVADGKVYCGDEDGDLVVFEAKKEKKIISQTNLGGPIYSTPVAANGVLYVHSNTHLFAFYDSEHKRMASDEKPKTQLELPKSDANK
jgi:outer membrane protein assembly factor BamB